eukprot:TRINITY_DN56638_c0_g1_i1.p1 TRINITY_DN56638_c0_g1~~TRINITY_DN56638_c0_g1_i1.p1  ORF type:complete len:202 (+),score=27.99 TRINITY_DN56638_c0_g1_i1:49-654(+)
MQIGGNAGRECSTDEETAPGSCTMDPAQCTDQSSVPFDSSRGIYPQCIVWTWLPGCTQCTAGLVGHMGITNSKGEVWEFVGTGAMRNEGQLAFGPIIRYVPLSPGLIWRGTCDEGIDAAIEKYRNLSCHPGNNCHCFVAACLHEMRFMGLPCWNWCWWLLAVLVWITGLFPARWSTMLCISSTLVLSGIVAGLIFYSSSSS